MQEHIRRAHPDHYIPKLPATEESFQAMINTVPSARPAPASTPSQHYLNTSTSPDSGRYIGGHNSYSQDRQSAYSSPAPTRTLDDPYPAAANAATAAVALAQLHGTRQDSAWASDNVSQIFNQINLVLIDRRRMRLNTENQRLIRRMIYHLFEIIC